MNGSLILNDHIYGPAEAVDDFIHNPAGIAVAVIVGLVVAILAAGAILFVIKKKRKNGKKDGKTE